MFGWLAKMLSFDVGLELSCWDGFTITRWAWIDALDFEDVVDGREGFAIRGVAALGHVGNVQLCVQGPVSHVDVDDRDLGEFRAVCRVRFVAVHDGILDADALDSELVRPVLGVEGRDGFLDGLLHVESDAGFAVLDNLDRQRAEFGISNGSDVDDARWALVGLVGRRGGWGVGASVGGWTVWGWGAVGVAADLHLGQSSRPCQSDDDLEDSIDIDLLLVDSGRSSIVDLIDEVHVAALVRWAHADDAVPSFGAEGDEAHVLLVRHVERDDDLATIRIHGRAGGVGVLDDDRRAGIVVACGKVPGLLARAGLGVGGDFHSEDAPAAWDDVARAGLSAAAGRREVDDVVLADVLCWGAGRCGRWAGGRSRSRRGGGAASWSGCWAVGGRACR
mmetsp:Transcript_4335/g.12422  ORF Transcript_4335/g.12422 Transcript_4335/m.12422 type:complete len:391 (-) Transcript_4335:634-1806(-)